jgi:hypothetical protein
MPQDKKIPKRVGADGTYMYRDVSYNPPKYIREINPMQDAATSKMMGRDITGGMPNMRDEIPTQYMAPKMRTKSTTPKSGMTKAVKNSGSYSRMMGISNKGKK